MNESLLGNSQFNKGLDLRVVGFFIVLVSIIQLNTILVCYLFVLLLYLYLLSLIKQYKDQSDKR